MALDCDCSLVRCPEKLNHLMAQRTYGRAVQRLQAPTLLVYIPGINMMCMASVCVCLRRYFTGTVM
jgi:hypothetical protein